MKKIFILLAVAAMLTACKKKGGTKQTTPVNNTTITADTIDNSADIEEEAAIEQTDSKVVAEGFVDFECEYEGKVQHFSDYIGKGKFMLVDFWASWCGPCRGEIPNIIAVYKKYKSDRFDVLGVATWDKPEDTKRAIAEDKIPYQQMMNAQEAGSDAYDIDGIPEIMLFAPDGTLLARGLYGKEIEKAVAKALK